jgi:hypothetical protein
MVTIVRRYVAAGYKGRGLPLVKAYQSRGGRNPYTIQVLRGIEADLSRTRFAGLSDRPASRLVGRAIANHARRNTASMARCGREYPVAGSGCQTLIQWGSANLDKALSETGQRIPGYNAPVGKLGTNTPQRQRLPRQ